MAIDPFVRPTLAGSLETKKFHCSRWNAWQAWLDRMSDILKIKFAIWSIYDHKKLRSFRDIPYPDMCKLIYTGWGDCNEAIEFDKAPTWARLWQAADALMRLSGDEHHQFIEGFEQTDRIGVYELHCGS